MNTEQAMTVLGNYLDMDEANRKKMLNLANNALETLRIQFVEYKRANRDLVVEREALKAQLDDANRLRASTIMVASNMKAEWDAMREERDKLQALVKELENPDLVATITPLRKLFAEYFDGVASLTYGGQVEGMIKGDDK